VHSSVHQNVAIDGNVGSDDFESDQDRNTCTITTQPRRETHFIGLSEKMTEPLELLSAAMHLLKNDVGLPKNTA
jgi:hypothetical protein